MKFHWILEIPGNTPIIGEPLKKVGSIIGTKVTEIVHDIGYVILNSKAGALAGVGMVSGATSFVTIKTAQATYYDYKAGGNLVGKLGLDLAKLIITYAISYEAEHAAARFAQSKGYTPSEVTEVAVVAGCIAGHNTMVYTARPAGNGLFSLSEYSNTLFTSIEGFVIGLIEGVRYGEEHPNW